MKECCRILEKICEILCEDINAELCDEIKKHLESCPRCSAYVDSIKKTITLVKNIEAEDEVPRDIHNRLHKVLQIKNCR